jgi:rhodanese-related sulfurtransferase
MPGKERGKMPQTVAGMVAAAKKRMENLTPDQVEREVRSGALLVDIREPEERAANGAIEGSAHAARGMLEFHADPTSPYYRSEFEPDRRIILYCASGGRSAPAGAALRELGYRDVAHLDGGVRRWVEAGKPISQT